MLLNFWFHLALSLKIVRDETGVPEVLLRKEKEFNYGDSGAPSAADDDSAPGAG